MDNAKPTETRRTVNPDAAPYWHAPLEPGGLQRLIELGNHGALKIALTIPDLVEAGLKAEVAQLCVVWAESVWRSKPEGERQLLDIAIGLALVCIDGDRRRLFLPADDDYFFRSRPS